MFRSASAEDSRIVIVAAEGSRRNPLAGLWEYRELLYFLTWRDLKVRYKQTAFGLAWAVLQPLLLMLVFSVSIGRIAGVAPGGIAYPLFALTGLVPWTLFSQGVTGASNSLVGGESIITKVYFPRLIVPLAVIASFLPDFLVAFVLLLLILSVGGVAPSAAILALPVAVIALLVTAIGVGSFLAALSVRYRDVRYAVPFLMQLWLFASPIVYASSLISPSLRIVYALNPLAGPLELFRWSLIGGAPPDASAAVSVAVSFVVLAIALGYFRRVERTFADVI